MKKALMMVMALFLSAGVASADPAESFNPGAPINVGTVEMAQADFEAIQAMVAGRFDGGSAATAKAEKMVDAGTVAVPASDLDALKAMVSGDYEDRTAGKAAPRDPMVDVGGVKIPQSDLNKLKVMVDDHLKGDMRLAAN